MNKNVIIISFSSRKQGNCDQIAEFLSIMHDSVKIYRFSEFRLQPCGTCQYECFQKDETCPYSADREQDILDAICSSDVAYFVIPNYQDYPCSNFFIFQERMQGYFHVHPEHRKAFHRVKKRFLVISNTITENFHRIAQQYGAAETDILILKSRKFGLSSIKDQIATTREVQLLIHEFVRSNIE